MDFNCGEYSYCFKFCDLEVRQTHINLSGSIIEILQRIMGNSMPSRLLKGYFMIQQPIFIPFFSRYTQKKTCIQSVTYTSDLGLRVMHYLLLHRLLCYNFILFPYQRRMPIWHSIAYSWFTGNPNASQNILAHEAFTRVADLQRAGLINERSRVRAPGRQESCCPRFLDWEKKIFGKRGQGVRVKEL